MFPKTNIRNALIKVRKKQRAGGEELLHETRRLLDKDLLSNKKILENLKLYENTQQLVNEEDVESDSIFTLNEIGETAIKYRLCLVHRNKYKGEIPYEATLKIEYLNLTYQKNINSYYVLADSYNKRVNSRRAVFIKTNYGHFYLLHEWGEDLPQQQYLFNWPLQKLENMAFLLIALSVSIALLLPGWLILSDATAPYWNGYRIALVFHLLILFSCFGAFFMLAFSVKFSKSSWNKSE
ncbi:MAG: hypothetical protein IT236_10550 [Bacteroidia bacterium]|nr:hypothetical protein [Bacteroidia bacterium]